MPTCPEFDGPNLTLSRTCDPELVHFSPRVSRILHHTTMASTITTARVAIVTGAAQGIGRAIALRLADDGLDVAVTDLPSQQKELDSLVEEITVGKKQRALAVVGDVTNEVDVQHVVNMTVAQLGSLDVVRPFFDFDLRFACGKPWR